MSQTLSDALVRDFKPTGPHAQEIADKLVQGLTLRCTPKGEPVWYLRLRTPDQAQRYRWKVGPAGNWKLYESTPKSKQARAKSIRDHARDLIAEAARRDLREGKRQAKVKASQRDVHTLDGMLDYYTEHAHTRRPEQTAQRVRGAFPDLLAKPVDQIDHWILGGWRNAALKKGKQPTSVNRDLTSLSAVLTMAVAVKRIAANPLHKQQRAKPETAFSFAEEPDDERVRYLSPVEEAALRSALAARDARKIKTRLGVIEHREKRRLTPPSPPASDRYFDELTPMVITAMKSGMRRGELFQLTWANVDLTRRQIHVRATTTKTAKSRTIPMAEEVREILTHWRKATIGQGRVFSNSTATSLKKQWWGIRDAVVASGVESFANARFHDMRHHCASMLVMRDVPLNTVRELLGHTNFKMTQRYAKLSPSYMADAITALDAPNESVRGQQHAS